MKANLIKILILVLALAWLAGCEEKIDYKKEEALGFDADQDIHDALQQKHMPLLAVKLGCNNCHALDHWLVGPDWQDVSKRYRNATTYQYNGRSYPLAEGLIQKVSHGGSGNWGVEAMPALDPNGSEHDKIGKLVNFILELNKQ